MAYRNIEDSRAAIRDHYRRNKQAYLDRNRRQRERIRKFVRDLKSERRCERCGFDNPAALDFHHRDGEKKDVEVANAVRRSWGEERILAEIVKCDVLCANCHRIEHHAPL
jgi:hypothetical protein